MLVRFVFLCVLVGGSIALPAAPQSSPDTDTTSPSNFAEFVKKFNNNFSNVFQEALDHGKWFTEHVESVIRNTVKGGIMGVETWAFDIVGRVELLTMADGSHFMVPLGGKTDVEQQYKTVSIAVSKLLRNLKSMERTDNLLTNVSRKVVSEHFEHHKEMELPVEKIAQNILHLYIETMDKTFESDEVLAEEYKRQKNLAKQVVRRDPKMREALFKLGGEVQKTKYVSTEEMKTFMQDKNVLREALVNKMFLKQSVKHFEMILNTTHHTRYLMSRALLQKAQSSDYESKVNEVYHKALVQARTYATATIKEGYPFVVSDALYSTIEKGLASEPTLHTEIQNLMKQIEATSVFGITDMFHIDFSPL